MVIETQLPTVLRFGTFELDLRARELHKQGLQVKLQEQPFRVLTALLHRPGEVVTREELRSQIWPADTFVDFDNGLNTAVNKLREALGDSSDRPRFIETLPRRGYRFIAPVARKASPAMGESPPESGKRVWFGAVPTLLLLIGLLIGAGLGRSWWRSHRLGGTETLVLGDVANTTGDALFDEALRQGLSVQLSQSPFLKLVSEDQIHQTLRMMGQAPDARLTPEIAREVCQRTNSAIALESSIALIGTRYDLILRALDCAGGGLVASAEARAKDKSQILDALSQVAGEIRGNLGESLGTLQKYNLPLSRASTPSLEALRSYSLGIQAQTEKGDFASSLHYFQRAIEVDPKFAMAYWALSDAYSTIGESALQVTYMRQAYDLRAGVSERERLVIEGDYQLYVTGDLIKGQRDFELLAQLYPDSQYAHNILAAIANMLGRYETGLKEYQEALHLAPFNSVLYRDVSFTNLLLNQVEAASATAKQAHSAGLDDHLAAVLYGIAFYQDDRQEMARQVASATGKPGLEDMLVALDADTAAYSGHLAKARELTGHALASAELAEETENAATYAAASALREGLFGKPIEARRQAIAARRKSSGRDLDYGAALALAYAGDTKKAQELANGLAKKFPEDTLVNVNYLPTLRAKLALNRSDSQQALKILEIAAPFELGLPAYGNYNWPNLYPIYVRGEAYLAARDGEKAAIEFRKILDHRNIVLNEPIGMLAHLQLARALAMAGDSVAASAAYQDFFARWKDADPNIPILNQARAECEKFH